MSNTAAELPPVESYEVDAEPPADDEQQRRGDPNPGREEIPTDLPPDNYDFVRDLPGRVDEE
jgi:hypothetical protein